MKTARYRDWFHTRIIIADRIVSEFPETGVYDADILLCCTASAFAAQMWPGEGIDRARFTQYLLEFATSEQDLSLISVPVLQEKLRDRGELTKSNALEDHFYPSAGLRILDIEEAHQSETRLYSLVSDLSIRDVRLSSLASIIYSEFRSGLVHTYSLSPYLSSVPGKEQRAAPSYMKWLVEPEEEAFQDLMEEEDLTREEVMGTYARQMRCLHLPHEFVRTSVYPASTNALAFWETAASWRRPRPSKWWLEGGSFTRFDSGA